MNPDNDESSIRRIPARSHRQVMDWSLVLASQEIETTIAKDESGWSLTVNAADYERAIQSITLYRKENRGFRWRQPVPGSTLLFHWGSALWCLAICWIYYWAGNRSMQIEASALMDNAAVAKGEWWRLFTAITLHGDVAHLASNATIGLVLIGLAMARFGSGFALLGSYLAGAGGNLFGFFLYDSSHRGLGASGMVMGALGLLAAQRFPGWQKYSMVTQIFIRGIATGSFLFILMGTTPGTDILAHAGGFLFGLIQGCLFGLVREQSLQKSVLNKVCLLLFPILVLMSWALALQ